MGIVVHFGRVRHAPKSMACPPVAPLSKSTAPTGGVEGEPWSDVIVEFAATVPPKPTRKPACSSSAPARACSTTGGQNRR